nr:unnamed protein product [Callosobruchus chinensis]
MQRKLRERRTCSCVFFSNGYRTAEEVISAVHRENFLPTRIAGYVIYI